MSARLRSWAAPLGCAALAASVAALCADASGLDAPTLAVDRFSDAAGTLFRRSALPGLPGPDEPIELDQPPFLTRVRGKNGAAMTCYDLDIRSTTPGRYYVFYDRLGNFQLGQLPVIDSVPGDPGYSDLWDVRKVIVPEGFRDDNSIRDRAAVERLLADAASGYTMQETGVLLNGPVVPAGSRAAMKGERRGGSAALRYAWHRGKLAPYLYLEGSLPATGMAARAALMSVPAGPPGADPLVGLRMTLSAASPVPAAEVGATPGDSGYSPLWKLTPENPATGPGLALNCPVVGM